MGDQASSVSRQQLTALAIGGSELAPLIECLREHPRAAVEVRVAAADTISEIASMLDAATEGPATVVLLSGGLFAHKGLVDKDTESLAEALAAPIERLSEAAVHVLLVNACTLTDTEAMARPGHIPPWTISAHLVDTAFIKLSARTHASLIDVDRLVAERGSAGLVTGPGCWSPRAASLVADEIVRVLEARGALLAPRGGPDRNMPVQIPYLPAGVRRVRVVEWLIAPRTAFELGDDLCLLLSVERVRQERATTARRMLTESKYKVRRNRLRRGSRKSLVLALAAGGQGRLVDVLADPGTELGEGDQIATVETAAGGFSVTADIRVVDR